MMNQWSQGAFYYYCFKTFKTQNFTIKLSNHLLKVNQIKQLPVGTILSFYYFGKTVHLRFCSSRGVYDKQSVTWCKRFNLIVIFIISYIFKLITPTNQVIFMKFCISWFHNPSFKWWTIESITFRLFCISNEMPANIPWV